jgi:hypothetical protein
MPKAASFLIQVLGLAFLLWAVQPIKAVLPWPATVALALVYLLGIRFIAKWMQSALLQSQRDSR